MMTLFNRTSPEDREIVQSPIPRSTPNPIQSAQPRKQPEHWPRPILDCPRCDKSDDVQPVQTIVWSETTSKTSLRQMMAERDLAALRGFHVDHVYSSTASATPTWYCRHCRLHYLWRNEQGDFAQPPPELNIQDIDACDSPQKWLYFKASEELDARAKKRKP